MHGTQFDDRPLIGAGRVFTQRDLDLIDELSCIEARDSFWKYRRRMRPKMKLGWWQWDLAQHLQQFYCDFIAGLRPKLVIQAPPQHGKTEQVEDFVAWISGKISDNRTIYASYSEELGARVNRELQRNFNDPCFNKIFPDTRIVPPGSRNSLYSSNSNLLEFIGYKGSFRNTTVQGAINGQGLDLGVIDDPLKGRNEAQGKQNRDKVWGWLTDDFFGRFSDHAGLIMMTTRWHIDDPVGRWIPYFPETKVLRYPAIAEVADRYRKAGEPLFPQHKSLTFLMERKKVLTQAGWEAVYQQNPIIVGGGMIPVENLRVLNLFDRNKVLATVRYWDCAGTEGGGAYTSGCLMHLMSDKSFVISHVARGQWAALERERNIKSCAELDSKLYKNYEVVVEQEPGSSGKDVAEGRIRLLAGFRVFADRVTGGKEIRAEPFAAQVQGNNVRLTAGDWVYAFRDECETFPSGKYKDQVDSTTGAFNWLAKKSMYDTTYAGWA